MKNILTLFCALFITLFSLASLSDGHNLDGLGDGNNYGIEDGLPIVYDLSIDKAHDFDGLGDGGSYHGTDVHTPFGIEDGFPSSFYGLGDGGNFHGTEVGNPSS